MRATGLLTNLDPIIGAIGNLQLPVLETVRLRALMLLSFWGLFRGSELCMNPGEQFFLRHQVAIMYHQILFCQTKFGFHRMAIENCLSMSHRLGLLDK